MINIDRNDFLYFDGRNRRPPKDPFNALLSFGYSLLYKDCVSALIVVGLDPSFGFYHRPRSSAYPLALDLMDLFRVIIWDIPLIGSVNRKQWTQDDFSITKHKVWLNNSGRKKAIKIYEGRKQEKWKHPVLNYSLSYARTLELEARLLEKEWTGTHGLFAKLRLR
jgi:CRISPR-associated protein Cas1